jgi:hypothetical protein
LGGSAALANPALQTEDREPLQDVALIIVDESGSNRLGERVAADRARRPSIMVRA